MQAQAIRIFIWTAGNSNGVTMAELQEKADVSAASLTRNVQALSKMGFKGKTGLDWLISTEDPMNRRQKIVKLTSKGHQVLKELSKILM